MGKVQVVTHAPRGSSSYDDQPTFSNEAPDWSSRERITDWMPGNNAPIFSEKELRLGFIRKVFGIFTLQILTTIGIVSAVTLIESIREYVWSNVAPWILIPLVVATVILLVMLFKTEISRKVPTNFVLLTIFTVLIALAVAAVSLFTDAWYVLYAAIILLFPCLTVTLYSLQTKFDLKWYGHFLISLISVAMVTGLIYLVAPPSDLYVLWIAAGGAVVISLYLTAMVHCILGAVCCDIRLENYVLVTFGAYLVVIGVFIIVLLLIGLAKDGGGDGCSGSHGGTTSCYSPFYCWFCFWHAGSGAERERRRNNV